MPRSGQGSAVKIPELRDFQRDLKQFDTALAKEFKAELKGIAEEAAMDARGAAQRGTPQQRRAAYNIVGSGSYSGGSIVVSTGNDIPYALGAFWGSKRAQFPRLPWVGNSWEVGGSGGPYFINEVIADKADHLEEQIGDLIDRTAVRTGAFPDHSF